jgi:hypothetical protein
LVNIALHKSITKTSTDLAQILLQYEVLLMCVSKSSIHTLRHLISQPKSNYAALQAWSLSGEVRPSIQQQLESVLEPESSSNAIPPHNFYFFTSPLEYFVCLIRVVLQTYPGPMNKYFRMTEGGHAVQVSSPITVYVRI